jgi:hypothetical protein
LHFRLMAALGQDSRRPGAADGGPDRIEPFGWKNGIAQ